MSEPTWFHLTARVTAAAPDLTRADTGAWLWTHLRAAFPQAIAVVLMPNHPHLVVPTHDPVAAAQRLRRLLGQFGRRFDVPGQISRVPAAAPIRAGTVLARQVRYVALNPCRARLASCPLEWPWSTHRDVIGAIADPWVTGERLAAALGSMARNFSARHHAYVSSDPDARVSGTALPVVAATDALEAPSLRAIAEACAAATRRPITALRERGPTRRSFVALAIDHGVGKTGKLADICGCTPRAIRKLAIDPDPLALQAARLCLADARLRRLPARASAA